MTALAIDLLREVSDAGGTVRLEGDTLRLLAPEPLPDDLRARLREHKAEIVALLSAAEPANEVVLEGQPGQNVAGLPREIADGVHAILSADGAREYRRNAGHGCNAILCGYSKAAGHSKPSTSAGPRPTCSAATDGHRGTGSTAPASSC